jgi:hypothetical protein
MPGVRRSVRAPFLGRDAATMIKKRYVKTRNVTKVTFAHPADVDVDDWNDGDADGFVPNGHGAENGAVAG